MNVQDQLPIRELYRQYLAGQLRFEDLMAITDRRLAQFDASYPLPDDTRERART